MTINLSQSLADIDVGTLKELLHRLRGIPAVSDAAKLGEIFASPVIVATPSMEKVVADIETAERTRVAASEAAPSTKKSK